VFIKLSSVITILPRYFDYQNKLAAFSLTNADFAHDKHHQSRVGIRRANFADFILDLQNCYSQLPLHNGLTR
jgi:hypothetical protein